MYSTVHVAWKKNPYSNIIFLDIWKFSLYDYREINVSVMDSELFFHNSIPCGLLIHETNTFENLQFFPFIAEFFSTNHKWVT